MELKAINNQVPVTALKFVDDNHILAGSGSFLKLYNWRKGCLVSKQQLFPVDDVHGIFPFANCSRAVVWGGASIALVSTLLSPRIDAVFQCKDRVIDVQVVNDGALAVVLTAHNEVLEVDLESLNTVKVHKCLERSILYSGKLYLSSTRWLAAAGTVFGGVVVWDLATDSITNRLEVHDGSIFDVDWSPDGMYIASCSDDRAICVSDLATNKRIAEGWGHVSRIWKLKFASSNRLISVAEDCSARVWHLGETELKCDRIMTGHQGRSVWSLDIICNGGIDVAATGGGDGKIMLWDLDQEGECSASQQNLEKWTIDNEFGASIRSCDVGTDGTSAVTTTSGNLFLRKPGQKWLKVFSDLGPVPIVKSNGHVFIAIASNGCGVFVDTNGTVLREFNTRVRVLDFFVLDLSTILIVPTPPAINPIFVSLGDAEPQQLTLEMTPRMGLPTCAVRCGDKMFCIGTRKGDLIVYTDSSVEPTYVHTRALGTKSDAVTQLVFIEDASLPYVVASSRSSEYGYFAVPDLKRLYKTRARKRGSIEGFSLSSQGLLLWGFQKDFFIAWNVTLGCDFIAMDCGGSHRSWALQVLSDRLVFTYVRASQLFIHTVQYPGPWFKAPLLQEGTHGREIRGLEACPLNKKLIASGSEDTMIKIGWLTDNHGVSNECFIRDGHVSGIQSLHWSPCGKYLFTGAGQGELVIWRVIAPAVNGPVFASEVGRMPSKPGTSLYELRVMAFSIYEDLVAVGYSDSSFRIWKLNHEDDGTISWSLLLESKYRECCLLNVDLVPHGHGELRLLITSTDGHLVMYSVSYENGLMTVQQQLREAIHQSSVRCSFINVEGETIAHYSGGDDNSVCGVRVYLGPKPHVEKMFRVRDVHASAVTSVQPLPDSDAFVSTGSDQKVNIWNRNSGELLKSAFTSVSDTGPMIVEKEYLITAGIGVEYFSII